MSTIFRTTRFLNDAAGLEKTLRGIQAIAQIYATITPTPGPWLIARKQLAISRRYFRPQKIIPAFTNSLNVLKRENEGGFPLVMWLDSMRWACLGLYFALEATTLLHAMGVADHSSWAPQMFVEANKFWFYALSLGIVIGMLELPSLRTMPPSTSKESKKDEDRRKEELETFEQARASRRRRIFKQMVVDSCDLFTPGSVTGWIQVEERMVAVLMLISTLVAGSDIWKRLK